jgi:dGTPase
LTHSLEVAQIAKTVARTLRLNADLSEAIALAHDLGHGPFGHSGEDALRELMLEHGGFDHNLQAIRIVSELEQRYPGFPGLNLTWEVRAGLNKHRSPLADTPKHHLPNLSLEAQVTDMADEVAYDHHDLDDGITSGLIKEEELRNIPLWKRVRADVLRHQKNLSPPLMKYQVIRRLIDLQVTDLIDESLRRIRRSGIKNASDAQKIDGRLIAFSPEMVRLRAPLKRFLHRELYHHYKVVRMANKAKRFVSALFEAFLSNTEQLPTTTRRRIDADGPHRAICDYIAGMTDRFAMDEYRKMFHPFERM